MIRLSVRDPDSGAEVLRMRWEDGVASVDFATRAELQAEMESVLRLGLVEWDTHDGHPAQRTTPSCHAKFLERLGNDLHRQFRFLVEVS